VTTEQIKELLKQVKYPGFSRDIVSFGLVRSAGFLDGTVKVALSLTTTDSKAPLQIKADVERVLRGQPGVKDILVEIAVAATRPAATPAGAAGGNLGGNRLPRAKVASARARLPSTSPAPRRSCSPPAAARAGSD